MFINNHDNYMISEFVILTNEHNICFFTFIFHLTHCMQSLDVSLFRQYNVTIPVNVRHIITN